MAALSENIGVLFRIKADTADAVRGIRETKQEVGGLEKSAATAGSSFASMANPAALAAVAITAIATAAVTATKYLWDITNAASEFGSKIFDASQKSGASVESIQALGFAAQQSGSSLEKISDSVSKFATLIGQAQLGNEKAQKTLEQFGITATDVDGALVQAIDSIMKMTDETKQNAAAAALFKDRGGDVINTIREMGGNLPDTIKKLRDLGVMLSKEDTAAADAFGDSLDTLTSQVKIAGYKFAFEFMPQITNSIRTIIQWLSANSGEVRKWGQVFNETISGIKTYFGGLLTGINAAMNGINTAFGLSARNAITWSTVMQGALGPIIGLLRMISKPGALAGDEIIAGTDSAISAVKAPGIQVPSMPTFLNAGGGSGGGSGRAKRDTSQEDADRIAERNLRARIQIAQNLLSEFQKDFSDAVATGLENLTGTDDESITALKSAFGEYLEQIQRAMTALHRLQDQERANMTDAEKDLLTQKQRLEKEQVRLGVKKELLTIDAAAADFDEKEGKKAQERIDAELKALEAKMRLLEREAELRRSMAAPIPAPDGQPALPKVSLIESQASVVAIDTLRNAFSQLGQAIGQVVSAWVLYGTAGQSARKVTAMILASIAQQAAVQAVFQLAEGFAKLAMAYFGVPNAGPSATAHFIAAGMYASIAGVAAVAGRTVAGNSFKQQTASATGGGSSGNNATPSETRYTTQFNGYGQGRDNILVRTLDRVNTTLGLVEETQHQFNRKVLGMSPTDVVVLGANGASREIRGAVESELSSDVRTTDGFMRGLGFAR